MKNLFIDLVQHELTEAQKEAVRELNAEYTHFRDVNSELYDRLRNSPDNFSAIYDLSRKLLSEIEDLCFTTTYDNYYLHLPIGSPAFMFQFAQHIQLLQNRFNLYPTFSHTERKVKELVLPDGTVEKKSIFEFKKFITL